MSHDKRILRTPVVTWAPATCEVHFDFPEPFFVKCRVCQGKNESNGGRITMSSISKLIVCKSCFMIEMRNTSSGGEEDPSL